MIKELLISYIIPRMFEISYHKDTARIAESVHSVGGLTVQGIDLDTLLEQLTNNRGINQETGLEGHVVKPTGFYSTQRIDNLVSPDTLQPIEYIETDSDPSFTVGTIIDHTENHGIKACTPSELADLLKKVRSRFNIIPSTKPEIQMF